MRRKSSRIQAEMDAMTSRKHLNDIAMLCLEMDADFEINHESRTIAIKDIGTDRSHYFKALSDEERPYIQSGKQYTLEEVKEMLTAIIPVNRALMPAYAYNYLNED